MAELPYRPNVCMLVRNEQHQLFLGEREGNPGVWQFPQGGVELEQSLEENVTRELEEELGADRSLFQIEKKLEHTNCYDFASIPAYAVGKWRGQAQTFWIVKFLGTDSDIRLDRHSPEFRAWRWVSAGEVRKYAEARRYQGYREALREFAATYDLTDIIT